MTKDLVRFILEHATDFEWSLQGFGMLRLYISDSIRLHVWDSRYRVPNVSSIHTHPWDFESTIVVGSIKDVVYETTHDSRFPEYNISRILCGNGAHLKAKLAGESYTIRLRHSTSTLLGDGHSYDRTWRTIHESLPADGTVTLVRRFFRADRDHAFVFWPIGTEWVSAEPRKATEDEVEDITTASLERWFK